MYFIVFLIAITGALELLLHAIRPRHVFMRTVGAFLVGLALIITSAIILIKAPNPFGVLMAVISGYRLCNIARIARGRMHEKYLWHVTYTTTLWLLLAQLAGVAVGAGWNWLHLSATGVWTALLLIQTLLAVVFFRNVRGYGRRMRSVALAEIIHDKDLPSLTVAIPARNETEDLHECITALLASHYQKLEIIVLDDCSQTTRTPEIIRGFAHDGVRFIQGIQPQETWLAKNQAYEALARAANGEIILFMGVDIRVEPDTLRRVVAHALEKKKSMVCVMPRNIMPRMGFPLIQPMRYVWELALPRRRFGMPPVLSSFWLITRSALENAGGFGAASRMVVPEAYFAKTALAGDGYSFIVGGAELGVTSLKTVAEQRDTAIRVGYPQLHRRPEMVALITLSFILWICAPVALIADALLTRRLTVQIGIAVVVFVLCALLYREVLMLAYGNATFAQQMSFPVATLVYVALLNFSMYRYEFSEVIWKGRNVCLPVMHVVPRLPRL